MKKNVSIDEALNIFLENWQDKMPVENIPIAEGEGRVLAKPIHALSDIPLVRASAMDGICVKSELFEDGKPVNPDTWLRGEAYDFGIRATIFQTLIWGSALRMYKVHTVKVSDFQMISFQKA